MVLHEGDNPAGRTTSEITGVLTPALLPPLPIRGGPSVLSTDQLQRLETGIDLQYTTDYVRPEIRYEETCFNAVLADIESGSIVIGPHLIDFMSKDPRLKDLFRPDAIACDVTSEDEWAVKRLYEFKSNKVRGAGRKLRGFSVLLETFRDQNTLLDILQANLPEDIPLPRTIVVPDDSKIDVVFVSPRNKKNIEDPAFIAGVLDYRGAILHRQIDVRSKNIALLHALKEQYGGGDVREIVGRQSDIDGRKIGSGKISRIWSVYGEDAINLARLASPHLQETHQIWRREFLKTA